MKRRVLLLFLVILALRISTWTLPLLRDGFGYAYIGKEVGRGAIIYRDVWDHKPPGVYAINAFLYHLSPQHFIITIRLTNVIVSFVASYLLFLLLVRYFSSRIAFVSTLLYAIFSNVYMIAQGDNLIETYMLPVLTLFYLISIRMITQHKYKWYIVSGLLISILLSLKQVGIFPFLPLIPILFFGKKRVIAIVLICIGLAIGILPWWFYFYSQHAVADALDGIYFYNLTYSRPAFDLSAYGQSLYYIIQVTLAAFPFWILTVLGLFSKRKTELRRLFLAWLLVSVASLFLGGKYAFTRHYFLIVLPAASYFVALALEDIVYILKQTSIVRTYIKIAVLFVFIPPVSLQMQFIISGLYFRDYMPLSIQEAQYVLGLTNYNFITSEKILYRIASYIDDHSKDNASIVEWGAEPEIYLMSKTSAPTKYFYNFPINGLFIQNEPKFDNRRTTFISDITRLRPIYIIMNEKADRHQLSYEDLDFPQLKNILRDRYVLETQIGNYLLFRIKKA